jgi:hypothetical protein
VKERIKSLRKRFQSKTGLFLIRPVTQPHCRIGVH